MKTKALVIGRHPFGEADLYLNLMTEKFGMITVHARSARNSKRRFLGGIDLFCHIEANLKGDPSRHPTLLELTVLNSFYSIRDSLEKLKSAGKAVQWVRKLLDEMSPSPSIYRLLGQTLSLIASETSEERLASLTLLFRWRLLCLMGLRPLIEPCTHCPQRGPFLWKIEEGKIFCNCQGSGEGSKFLTKKEYDTLNLLDELKLSQWKNISMPHHPKLMDLVQQFTYYHTHIHSLPR